MAAQPSAKSSPPPRPTMKKGKKASILKKKDEAHSSGQGGPSVSFDIDFPLSSSSSSAGLTRTKSSDSNLSYDSETGYWSGGESVTGILKHGSTGSSRRSSEDSKGKNEDMHAFRGRI